MAGKVKTQIQPAGFPTDFELFFRMSADIMLVATLDGSIIDFNAAYERITGYSREELFALRGGWGIMLEEDIQRANEQLQKLQSEQHEVINYELRVRTKNGDIKTIAYDASVNKISGHIYAIGRDVTQIRMQAQSAIETESRLRFFFDHSLDGMSIIVDGIYHLVNPAFLKILGSTNAEQVVGHHFLEFVAQGYKEKVARIVETNSDEMYTSRIMRLDDGSERNVEVTGKTLEFRNQKVRISVVRDMDERRRMQEKVTENEARFKAVFQNASVGIALTDEEGNFIEANSALLQRLGYTWDEMQNMQIFSVLDKDDRVSAKKYFKQLFSGKISTAFMEKGWQRKDGTGTWSKMTCNLMQGAEGQTMILSLIEDIDVQKRGEQALMESEEKFRAVYESSPMGIVITAEPGVIHDVNNAFATMLGYHEHELHGTMLLRYVHPGDIIEATGWLDKIYTREAHYYAIEKRYVRKDGTTFWAREVMSGIFYVGEAHYSVAIVENIETKKRTEDALESKNKELTQTNQELEHFAYVASHDLQEPLRTITSFIQILERRYKNSFDADAQQFMGFIVDGARRMQLLIQDLLEYSRINRPTTGFERIDLNEVFHTVIRVLKEKIEDHDALVMAEPLPKVVGNRVQLTQVFQNLVDNAIKFKDKKRKPEILVSIVEHKDTWELIFKDNGIGISEDYFNRIFVIFQRLHTLEEYSGTGIGLALCRKIIERHGGEIWVKSKPGKGSEFHFTISKKL